MNGGNLCSGSGCSNWAGTPYANLGWVSDAWVSFDNGITWQQIASSTNSWFAEAATLFDANGYWYSFLGQTGPPAVANAYSWSSSGFVSTLSFNNIASWTNPKLTIPASWTGANQPPRGFCANNFTGPNNSSFNFMQLGGSSTTFPSRVDSTIQPLIVPSAYTDTYGRIGYAPAGSWLLYGTQNDVWISINNGFAWSLLAGLTNNNLPGNDSSTWAATGAGNSGCSHRTTFNRFYWMGVSNQNGANIVSTAPFFNYVSVDGQEWRNIVDAASSTAMTARQATEFGICVVDKNERVYSVGGADMWSSGNLGVTWSAVVASTYFTPVRQDHSGGIYYTPGTTQENIIIMGGRGWTPATQYGPDYNDVWITTNYGASWQRQTPAAPWIPRYTQHTQSPHSHTHTIHSQLKRGGREERSHH